MHSTLRIKVYEHKSRPQRFELANVVEAPLFFFSNEEIELHSFQIAHCRIVNTWVLSTECPDIEYYENNLVSPLFVEVVCRVCGRSSSVVVDQDQLINTEGNINIFVEDAVREAELIGLALCDINHRLLPIGKRKSEGDQTYYRYPPHKTICQECIIRRCLDSSSSSCC
nr:MAG: putative movement protein P1 [Sobemovirus sp.]